MSVSRPAIATRVTGTIFSRLFRSRWAALFWSAGVLWTAYDIAGGAPAPPAKQAAATDATGEHVDAADLAALANAAVN